MKALYNGLANEILSILYANNNIITLEDLANKLEVYSHNGGYDYMLLGIAVADLSHKGEIIIKYGTNDIVITN